MSNDMNKTSNSVLRLQEVGEESGYYRTYYKNVVSDDYFAVIDFRGKRTWYTTDRNYGEPDMPLKDGLILEIERDGNVVWCEKITRIDSCTAIGKRIPANIQCFPQKETVAQIRNEYPPGCRVELVSMDDPYSSLKPGDCGTVVGVDDAGTAHIKWDRGSSLGAVYREDKIKRI